MELRDFAFGELRWSKKRYLKATIDEFNRAAAGYWRSWQRNTAWLMRELVFTMIQGNPYIKGTKPGSSKEILKIWDDRIQASNEQRRVSPEELEEATRILQGINKPG